MPEECRPERRSPLFRSCGLLTTALALVPVPSLAAETAGTSRSATALDLLLLAMLMLAAVSISALLASRNRRSGNRTDDAPRTEEDQVRSAEAVYMGAPDAIVTIRDGSLIEAVNPAAEALFGYSAAEMIGQPLGMLMPPEMAGRHDGLVQRSGHPGGTIMMGPGRDLSARHRDGSPLPVEVSVSRMDRPDGRRFIGIIRDVSRQRATEAELRRSLTELERSNADLDTFAYVASHDLKAPLRVIDNAAQWLAEDLEPHLTEDTRDTLDLLRSRVLRMERLLDDLLLYARVSRREQTAPMTVDGQDMAETIRALTAARPGIDLLIEDSFTALQLPQMPLQNVLVNLVSNAIKHHDKPRGTVTLSAMRPDPVTVCFTVTDDGPGIPPEFHSRIFDMFQTLRPRDQVDGSGMGLAIVQRYVQLAGGSIAVQSDGENGCTFRLTWPVAEAPAPEMHNHPAEARA